MLILLVFLSLLVHFTYGIYQVYCVPRRPAPELPSVHYLRPFLYLFVYGLFGTSLITVVIFLHHADFFATTSSSASLYHIPLVWVACLTADSIG